MAVCLLFEQQTYLTFPSVQFLLNKMQDFRCWLWFNHKIIKTIKPTPLGVTDGANLNGSSIQGTNLIRIFNVFHVCALYYTKTLITSKCTKRVLSSIVTHSYMFRPSRVETCGSVLRLMIKLSLCICW
jgi:hypothetical protein